MTRVVLIRPGSTDYDDQGRIQGTLNLPLSERGQAEAADAAERLRDQQIHRIYCGAEESARATARTIAKALGLRLRELKNLHNVNQGLWQGLPVEEVRQRHPRVYRQWCDEPTTVCPPEGETVMDALERTRSVLKPLLRRHRDETIGLVVPQPLDDVVRCYLTERDLSHVWDGPPSNGRWEVVDVVVEQAKPSTRWRGVEAAPNPDAKKSAVETKS
jgi:broad specificity phosphatase PhoE